MMHYYSPKSIGATLIRKNNSIGVTNYGRLLVLTSETSLVGAVVFKFRPYAKVASSEKFRVFDHTDNVNNLVLVFNN